MRASTWIARSALAALSLTSAVAAAADARPAKPTMSPRVPGYSLQTEVYDFPSGLRIMFQVDHSYPVVSDYTIVNHGSSDDPPGKDENAHFVEHTWFRSVHGDLPPIMDVVQDISGVFNASTWNDWTNYSTVASSEYLPVLMRLDSLRLTEFYKGMTEEQTNTEREVIRNEWRRRNENNNALLFDYLFNVVYPEDHPYHSTSTHDTIDNLKLADLQHYVDTNYKPDQTTITFVGDVPSDPREQVSLIFENFDPSVIAPGLTSEMLFLYPKPGVTNPDQARPGDWLTGAWDPSVYPKEKRSLDLHPYGVEKDEAGNEHYAAEKRPPRVTEDRPPIPPLGSKEVAHEKAPIDHPIAIVGWALPGGFRKDHIDLYVLGNLAGAFMVNGLSTQYRMADTDKNKQIGTSGNTGCFTQPEVINSTLMCLAEVLDPDVKPEDVVEKMLDQFAEMWNPDYQAELEREFSRARNELLADEILHLDNIVAIFGGRADTIGTYAHLTSNPNYYSTIMQEYSDIQTAQISKMGADYMKRQNAARLVVTPLDEDDVDTTSSESGYIGASKSDDVIHASDDLSKVTADDIAAARIKPDTTKIVDFKLDNGLRVVIMPHGETPIVQASLLFGGGTATDPRGTWAFAADFTEGGANDPLQIAGSANWPFQPGVAGFFAASSFPMFVNTDLQLWPNAWRMDLRAPSGDLDSVLWILRDEVEAMHPYTSDAATWKKKRKEALEAGWAKVEWHINDAQWSQLFPNAWWEQQATWEEIAAEQDYSAATVQTYLDHHIDPDNAVLLIVGNVKPEDARTLAQQQFGGWKGKVTEGWKGALATPEMPTAPTRVLIFDDPLKTQSQTDFMCRLNFRGEEDRPAAGVLASLANTKVFDTLRVKEALTYTPYAFDDINDDGSASLVMGSLALNKGVGRTVQYFLEVAKEVEAAKIDANELTLHKLRLARESGIPSQSVDQMMSTLTGPIRRGEGWDRIDQGGADIARVAAPELTRLIQGCTEHAVITMQGPKEVIGPELQALGIPYEVVDWKARGDELLGKYDPKELKKKQKAKAKADKKEAKEGGTDTPAPAPAPFQGRYGNNAQYE